MPKLSEIGERIKEQQRELSGVSEDTTSEESEIEIAVVSETSERIRAAIEDARKNRGAGTSGWELTPGSVLN